MLTLNETVKMEYRPCFKTNYECISIIMKEISHQKSVVYMTAITPEEEAVIDDEQVVTLNRDGFEFNVHPRNIYCYGEVDMSDNSDDLDTIDTFNWFNGMIDKGVMIPANYNYATHSALTDLNKPRWTETFSPAVVAQFTHGILNKPNRICIFKYVK